MGRWVDAVLESEMRNRVALLRAGRDSFPAERRASATSLHQTDTLRWPD